VQNETAKLKCNKFSVTPGTELGFIGTMDEVRGITVTGKLSAHPYCLI